MSQENLETLRAGFDAFARADREGFLRCMASDVRFEPHLSAIQGSYVGHEGVNEFFSDNEDTLAVLAISDPEIRDLGDRALALGTFRVGGRRSGIDAEVPFAIVARFRDGLITSLKDYGNEREDALKAAGISA